MATRGAAMASLTGVLALLAVYTDTAAASRENGILRLVSAGAWLQTYKQKPLADCDPETPLVIWLQGGPGASGTGVTENVAQLHNLTTGFGQFTEVGPYGTDWEPRKHAWTDQAHVLFVDNPVGTGFSYVEDGGSFGG
eukprot:scaffold9092_cov43-Prasinocladus_malaysianus.AAC.1